MAAISVGRLSKESFAQRPLFFNIDVYKFVFTKIIRIELRLELKIYFIVARSKMIVKASNDLGFESLSQKISENRENSAFTALV